MHRLQALTIAVVVVAGCATSAPRVAVTRERAIAIARAQIRWKPTETKATRTTSRGRQVWRVSFKGRLPGQPPSLFESAVIDVDVTTGEIVSFTKT